MSEPKEDHGYGQKEDAMIEKAVALIKQSVVQNWQQIKAVRDKSELSKVTVSIGFTLNCGGPKPLITGKLAFSEKHTDDFSDYVDDPNQAKLPIGEVV